MTSLPRAVLVLVLVTAAWSCGASSGPSDPQEAAVHLAPDSVSLVDGPVFRSSAQFTYRIGVKDVSSDGNRVAVLRVDGWNSSTVVHDDPGCAECPGTVGNAGGTTVMSLYVSEDRGATWRAHPIPWNEWQGNGGPYGVHLAGGRALLFGENENVGAHGDVYATFTIRELDLSKDAYVPNATLDGKRYMFSGLFRGGRGTTVASRNDLGLGNKPAAIQLYDMATRILKTVTPQYPAGADACGLLLFSLDGKQLVTFCSSPAQMCEVTYDIAAGTTTNRCIPFGTWPPNLQAQSALWSGRGLIALGADQALQNAAVGGFNAAGAVEVQPLFPIRAGVDNFGSSAFYAHPQAATLLLRSGGGGPIDITSTGATRYDEPTPCSDAQCGVDRFLFWMELLDDGSYLSFTRVNSRLPDPGEGPAYHDHIYVRRVHLSGGVPMGAPGATSGVPGAHAPSAIEAACLVANSCSSADFQYACPSFWSGFLDTDPARIAFLAAAHQGCAAMNNVYKNGACTFPNCSQNVPTRCSTAGADH